jgi:hypothetical protein
MSRNLILKYVTPWVSKRERAEQARLAALRERDGDDCRRCRRPIRFDLPRGHDKGPTVEQLAPAFGDEPAPLDHFCLTHLRCNAAGADNTAEVTERVRRRSEAELFAKSRRRAQA